MEIADFGENLAAQGVVLLRGIFRKDALMLLRSAAEACSFTPFSYSLALTALLELGVASREELLAPLAANGLRDLLAGSMVCSLDHSWVRKRFGPSNAPPHYHPNSWHQDGGLGVAYRPEPDSARPMTRLLTCWIPLSACGQDCPGLEFVRQRQDELLHYTELEDLGLRRKFTPEQFWAPELEFGDGLVFLAGSLHRTYTRPEMRHDRLSVEYRFFPQAAG